MRDAACVMRSLYIAIPDEAALKLRELARRELRAPRQQAAILVLEGLERAELGSGSSLGGRADRISAKLGRTPGPMATTGPRDGAK